MIKIFKKISAFICAGALACTALAFSAFADSTQRVYVEDNVLTESEKSECEKVLQEAADDKGFEFRAYFFKDASVNDSTVRSYARSLSNKSANCVAMVVNYGTNYAIVDAHGDCSEKLTSDKCSKIFDKYLKSELKDKDNIGAVKAFVKGVKRYTAFITLGIILIGLIGFVIFFMIMYFSVKAKYKFHEKPNTNNYLEGGALEYSVMEDIFIREHTSRTTISSGSRGGGGGGGGHSSGGGHF